ncbi:MAG: HDOD domain-containing protein [bacterium]|nr:HDOD domain-containing protein [bacterium]
MMAPNLSEAVSQIDKLPTLPAVLGQILDTMSDPDSSALDLARHIAADQSLSARMLQLVNSGFYGFYRQITNITDAIVILGFSETRDLILTATAFTALPVAASSAYDRTELWRHSLATAMAADRIAKRLRLPAGQGFFSAGLLHDVGKVALDALYPDLLAEAAQQAHSQERELHQIERESYDLTHADIGGLLADHWNLPETVVTAIRHHHDPHAAPADSSLAPVTALANYVSYMADLGEPSNGCVPGSPQAAMEATKFTEEMCEKVAGDLVESTERIDRLLGCLGAAS